MTQLKQWNMTEVSQAINRVEECIISSYSPAEDWTTQGFNVRVEGSEHNLFIRGFRTNQISPSKNNNMIEMVEVNSGYSDGDMPNDPVYVVVHAKVKAEIMKLGYQVVNSLDPYF